MCEGCYKEYGSPVIINEFTKHAASLIEDVFELSSTGGNAHIVIDDWNLDDRSIKWCLKEAIPENICESNRKLLFAEKIALTSLSLITVEERASALAIVDGYIKM